MIARVLIGCLALGCVTCAGCRTGAGDSVGPFPSDLTGRNITAVELAEEAKLAEGEGLRERRVGEADAAEVHVVHTTGEIAPYRRKKHDQVFFVVSGNAISEVNGIRDTVGPGSVVVAPRGRTVRFVRGDTDAGKPLLLVRVTTPRDMVEDAVPVEVPKKKARAAEDKPPRDRDPGPQTEE